MDALVCPRGRLYRLVCQKERADPEANQRERETRNNFIR